MPTLPAGEADVHYGHNIRPYLLSHVRPSGAAQQAACQASASLPAKLRRIADFYSSAHADRREEALDVMLTVLQEPLQQQYAAMWGLDSISVFVIKVSKQCNQAIASAAHCNTQFADCLMLNVYSCSCYLHLNQLTCGHLNKHQCLACLPCLDSAWCHCRQPRV